MSINVWHNTRTFSPDRDKPALFPDHFTLVASVETSEPGEAYELTNSITNDWKLNDGVTPMAWVPMRSTSVGDVMELADGRLLLVKGMGFGEMADKVVDWRDAYA